MINTDQSWRKYGEVDPYFGVLSDAKFERQNLTDASLGEFFGSGEEHVESVLKVLSAHVSTDFRPSRALDYGCGVGRVLLPLARYCDHVTGVDISQGMLEEAKKNGRTRNVSNISLVLADDGLSHVSGKFDLIHSYIVLQHIPAVRGTAIISALIDRLSVGGVAALHVPYLREVSRAKRMMDWARPRFGAVHMAANLAKGHPAKRPFMLMGTYDLNHLFRIFQKKNCQVVFADFLNHGGNYGVFLYVQKTAE